jgi:hypothetical protein
MGYTKRGMLVCSQCKSEFPFKTRKLKGEQVPLTKCDPCRAKVCERVKKYNKTPKGKANTHKTNTSAKGVERTNRYNKTDKANVRFVRHFGVRMERRLIDKSYRMNECIRSNSKRVIKGKDSPKFVLRTSFESSSHFRRHMQSTLPDGMTLHDHGILWEIEHKIPTEAYDMSNPIDRKRCWSPANMRGYDPKKNKEKTWKIIDSLCKEVGEEFFPLSWNGVIPSEDEKQAFYAKCLAGWNHDNSSPDSE